MKLKTLELKNWCQHEHREIQFPESGRPLLIKGRNNIGKSNLLKAICFTLDLTPGKSAYGSERSINNKNKAQEAFTKLTFIENGIEHTIKRGLARKKNKNYVEMDGQQVTLTEALDIFENQWGMPHPNQLISLLLLPQGRTDMLVREAPSIREERMAKIKGIHRIKAAAKELEKTRLTIRNEKDNLAAEGIIDTEKCFQLENQEKNLTTLKTEYELTKKQILPTETIVELHEAKTQININALKNEIKNHIPQLPKWGPLWMINAIKAIKNNEAGISPDEIIRNHKQNLENTKINEQITNTQKQLEEIKTQNKMPPAENWASIQQLHTVKTNLNNKQFKLPETIPTPEQIQQFKTNARLSALFPDTIRIQNEIKNLPGTQHTLPYETEIQSLQAEMLGHELPEICPISNNPLTTEGFQQAIQKSQERIDAANKNQTITQFLQKAKCYPELVEYASITGIPTIIKIVKEAQVANTPEAQNHIRNEQLYKEVQELKAKETHYQEELGQTYTIDELKTIIDTQQKIKTLENQLKALGTTRAITTYQIQNPEQETAIRQIYNNLTKKQNLENSLKNPEKAAQTAQNHSLESIEEILTQNEEIKQKSNTLNGQIQNEEKNIELTKKEIQKIRERKKLYDEKKEEEEVYTEAINFLHPSNGPREILRIELEDALTEVNQNIESMGIDLVLKTDAELQILAGTEEELMDPETSTDSESLGYGYGALAGTFLHAAFIRQFNETTNCGRIENFILDEPTAPLQLEIKPQFYKALLQNPETPNQGIIIIEHGNVAESFVENTITL